MKKGVFKKFAKFTVKHLCQRLFLNKVEDLKHTYSRCFFGYWLRLWSSLGRDYLVSTQNFPKN